jgi:hypothetical protein
MTSFTATQTTTEGGIITGEPRNAEPQQSDRVMLMAFRQALLIMVDAIERRYGLDLTSEARRRAREMDRK